MKFLFSEDVEKAVNVNFIEMFIIDYFYGESVYVKAKTATEECTLKTFSLGNREKNITAAKDYLADLVKTLNEDNN